MPDPCFFGYGSLVNRRTHDYPGAAQATAQGWVRAWRHTAQRPVAYLTAVPKAGAEIHGLIAAVPDANWAALDAREYAYERRVDTGNIQHARKGTGEIAIYAIPQSDMVQPTEQHPILLSYLDVVVQGYLSEFGAQGVAHFFETTEGWDAPVLNDRVAPIYPRHQVLTVQETQLVDDHLAQVGAQVITHAP